MNGVGCRSRRDRQHHVGTTATCDREIAREDDGDVFVDDDEGRTCREKCANAAASAYGAAVYRRAGFHGNRC